MKQRFDFEEIRPLYDEEVPEVIANLLDEPFIKMIVHYLDPALSYEEFKEKVGQMKTKYEFQTKVIVPFLWKLAERTTDSLDMSGIEDLDKDDNYTFISNHRDIVLDAAFLSILLFKSGRNSVEVAIGDNLLVYPWIRSLVRLNKSFIVKRDVPVRQLLEVSRRLSSYIHFALKIKGESIWIAQREGRSKDSTDRTQEGLIKMLAMGGGKNLFKSVQSLNIAPVAISYEYDPCDYLKAREFQEKRDNPDYKKSKKDDLINMQTGLIGYKGRVHFQVSGLLADEMDVISQDLDKTTMVSQIAQLIDRMIHRSMRMYEVNYVAYDLLYDTNQYAKFYTEEQKETVERYITNQVSKIDLPGKDESFLRQKMLEMYSNPLINYEKARLESR